MDFGLDAMPAAPPRRTITDELLTVSVRIKREAGVGHAQIQAAVDKFASEEHWHERTGGIGFPTVEDIPQERRDEFMAALAALTPEADRSDRHIPGQRFLSASDIWPSRVA
jgi:hypothetical protein